VKAHTRRFNVIDVYKNFKKLVRSTTAVVHTTMPKIRKIYVYLLYWNELSAGRFGNLHEVSILSVVVPNPYQKYFFENLVGTNFEK